MQAYDNLSNAPTRSASPRTVVDKTALADELRLALPTLQVLAPGEKAFEAERTNCWNKDVIHMPAAIVQPETTEEVCRAVKVAAQRGARLVIAGGRHGHDCMADDALVLDMSRMKAVHVDAAKRLVTVEGGCRLGDMDRACQPFGLACVTGTNPDTGVVGLSLCGGGGYLSRRYGMAVDNFHSAEVVTAAGVAVTATKDNEHRELLWGLQGAGSNFGVVTKLTMRAHPVDHVYGGLTINVAVQPRTSKQILNNWRDWLLEAPRSVNSMAVLPCGAPVVPMVVAETDPEVVPQAADAKCATADIASLKGAFGGMGSFGSWLSIKQLKRMRYHTELQPLLEEMQASGSYYDTSAILPELTPEVIECLVEHTRVKHPNSLAGVIVFPLSGAIADAAPSDTAFFGGGRKPSGFWIIIEGKFDETAKDGADRAKVVEWAKGLKAALDALGAAETAHTLDGNMEASSGGPDAIFGESNAARLRNLKAVYDPTNFFQCNRNVKPA